MGCPAANVVPEMAEVPPAPRPGMVVPVLTFAVPVVLTTLLVMPAPAAVPVLMAMTGRPFVAMPAATMLMLVVPVMRFVAAFMVKVPTVTVPVVVLMPPAGGGDGHGG